MTSMSLAFILCETEDKLASPSSEQGKKKTANRQESNPSTETSTKRSVARRRSKGESSVHDNEPPAPSERQQHVRYLQNMRQRRYRERKKSTASALQTTADNLHQENEALETAILEHFNMLLRRCDREDF